jgi:hypothetical protein
VTDEWFICEARVATNGAARSLITSNELPGWFSDSACNFRLKLIVFRRLARTALASTGRVRVSILTVVEDFDAIESCVPKLGSGSPFSSVEHLDLPPGIIAEARRRGGADHFPEGPGGVLPYRLSRGQRLRFWASSKIFCPVVIKSPEELTMSRSVRERPAV